MAHYVNPSITSTEPSPPSALRDFVAFVVAFAAKVGALANGVMDEARAQSVLTDAVGQ